MGSKRISAGFLCCAGAAVVASAVFCLATQARADDAGTPEKLGELDKDAIRDVIGDHRPEIRKCFEDVVPAKPTLAGKVVVVWTVTSTGAVSDVKLAPERSTLLEESVTRCMVAKIKAWRFPAPSGGGVVHISFPWTFKAGQGGK